MLVGPQPLLMIDEARSGRSTLRCDVLIFLRQLEFGILLFIGAEFTHNDPSNAQITA